MKRISALAVALLLAAAVPAYAVSLIAGTDTGGAQGHNTNSGSTTIAVTTTADSPIGSLVVAMCAANAGLTWSGVTDSAGNTYSAALANTLQGTNTVRTFYTKVTTDLPIGGTVTCTSNSASSSKTMVVASASGLAASPLDAASVLDNTHTSATYTTGPTGTLAYPGGANGEILFGVVKAGTTAAPTNDPAFTSLGVFSAGAGASADSAFGYLIVNASTPITYAPTGVSSAYVGNLAAFIGTGGGSAPVFHGLSAIGAGK